MFSQGIPINLENCTQTSKGDKVIMNTYYNLHLLSLLCDCLSTLERTKFGFKHVYTHYVTIYRTIHVYYSNKSHNSLKNR